jgi:hypothetical protein
VLSRVGSKVAVAMGDGCGVVFVSAGEISEQLDNRRLNINNPSRKDLIKNQTQYNRI